MKWDPVQDFREEFQTLAAAGAVLACKVIRFILLVLVGNSFYITETCKEDE